MLPASPNATRSLAGSPDEVVPNNNSVIATPTSSQSATPDATHIASNLRKPLRATVKLYCTAVRPNFSSPWQMTNQMSSTASGFVLAPLESRRILTNAHAVANQVQVMLRMHGNARKFPARVLAVGHECDIAMLTVDSDEFWDGDGGVEALELGGLPTMQESVIVVGFPRGGDNVCVTKGVVSRLDLRMYSHGRCSLLTVQTDAPINSGNSGGPVLLGDMVVGLAFQSLIGAENTGYVIPTPVVHHFLNDLKRGRYTGFPDMGVVWRHLESPEMKAALAMPKEATGVYIADIDPMCDAFKDLRAGDVLTSVDGHSIADDGTFMYPEQSVRIDFRHLPSMAYDGDVMRVGIWRDGAAQEVDVGVSIPRYLVPPHSHEQPPSYYVFAGFVFTRLTMTYLYDKYGGSWNTRVAHSLCLRCSDFMQSPGQEVVILSKVLSANVNHGFQGLWDLEVFKVNGVKVHNLAHLARMVEECDTEFIRFDLDCHEVVLMRTASGRAANKDILRTNCIPDAYSKGLLDKELVLPCDLATVKESKIAGEKEGAAGEEKAAAGAEETEPTAGAGETEPTAGAGESEPTAGAGETEPTAGAGGKEAAAGAGVTEPTAGAKETKPTAGAGEEAAAGAGETEPTAGAGETEPTAGAGETEPTAGAGGKEAAAGAGGTEPTAGAGEKEAAAVSI